MMDNPNRHEPTECPSKQNPLGLAIGDRVRVKAKVEFLYDDDGNKAATREEYERPMLCHVVGIRRKAEGKYEPATEYFAADGEPDMCGPHLATTRMVLVYECKPKLSGKIFLVMPEDIMVKDDA